MENGYSSPRADKFPAGLRVLVVDDDPTWLKILEKMLKKCSYEVTTCCLARDALNLLRERKYGFDLVISDVNMPDMDGFKLLEHVGLEMDLPVIMMSVDGETSRVMKGVQHGACDYLLKPIRMKELSNIWQHVLRKKIHEAKDTDYYECFGNFQLIKNKSEDFHDGILTNGASLGTLKKRKEADNIKHDDQETVDPSSKKARVVWTVDLHQKFVDAVNQIGFDKVGPKKILDTMKVPGLTRENVASHLQKFRLYLGRLEKENELNASLRGTKLLEFPAGDPPGSFGFQNSFGMGQNNVVNDNFGHTRNIIRVDGMGQKVHEGDLKGMVSFLQARTIKNPLTSDLPDHQKSIITPQIEPNHSIKSLAHSFEYQSLESTRPAQQWNEVPMMQSKQPLKQIPKHEPKPYSLLEANCKTRLFSGPVPEHHFQVNFQHPSPSVDIQMPPSENGDRTEFLVRRAINSIALTADGQIINPEAFKAISATTSSAMRNQIADQHCIDNWTPVQQKIIAGGSTLMPSLEENIQFLLQEYGRGENIGYQNCYYNPELIDELQTDCYGELGIHWDKLHGSIESNFVDQSLFIA